MRIAIFSDVHGNLSALQAVLADIDRHSDLDQVIFAGDLCLVGPRPQATLNVLRERDLPAIVGNTDEWIRQPPPLPDSLPEAERSARLRLRDLCLWTEGQLSAESLLWLDDLRSAFQIRITPSSIPAEDLLIVHANPQDLLGIIFPSIERQQELYGRIRQPDEDLIPVLGDEPTRTIAFGHLHIPGLRFWRDKQLINVSSVSLPGDGDSRAKYAILTWDAERGWTAEFIHVEYAIADEIDAYRDQRPPGWQERVDDLRRHGYTPQIV
ncbi:MAG: metallophosphoesterase family protein [Chloroflexota bacterium]|nr:MAG: metallophosphoesterase family protein [Chloroflexota bacterium]